MIRLLRIVLADPTLRMASLASLLFGSAIGSLAPYQSLIATVRFGLADTAYAAVLIATLTVSVVSAIGIGILNDQNPRRRRTAAASAVAMLAGALIVWTLRTPLAFVAAHALLLPISSALFPQIFAVVRLAAARHPPADRDGLLAIVRALFALPFVTLLPLWGLAIDRGLPMIAIYPGVAVMAALLLILILRLWPADNATPWVETPSGLGFSAALTEILARPVFLRVMLIGAVHCGAAILGVIAGLAFRDAGRSSGDVALFFGSFIAIEFAVTLSIGILLRFAARLALIAAGTVIYAGFLVLLPLLAPLPAVWFLVVPAGVGGGLIYALAMGYMQDLLHTRTGAGSALLSMNRLAADGLCAMIYGFGAWVSGYGLVALLGAVTMLFAIATILWIDRPSDTAAMQPHQPADAG